MYRYITSIFIVSTLIGCGQVKSALDLKASADKQEFEYIPTFEKKKGFFIKSGNAPQTASPLRGVAVGQQSYYGTSNQFVSDANSLFSSYPGVLSAVVQTTIQQKSYRAYYETQYFPNYASGQFAYWGNGNQWQQWRGQTFKITMAASVLQYRVDYRTTGYGGYSTSGQSPYGRSSYLTAWNVSADKKTLTLEGVSFPGSAIIVTHAGAVPVNPTLNYTAVVTPIANPASSTASTPVTVTRNLTTLVAKPDSIYYPTGYGAYANYDEFDAGELNVSLQGLADSGQNNNYCYNSFYYCFD